MFEGFPSYEPPEDEEKCPEWFQKAEDIFFNTLALGILIGVIYSLCCFLR